MIIKPQRALRALRKKEERRGIFFISIVGS
jgi:hypothetical protein